MKQNIYCVEMEVGHMAGRFCRPGVSVFLQR